MAIANFPEKLEEKNTYYIGARSRIGLNMTRLGVTTDNKDLLDNLMDDANGWIAVKTKHSSEDGNTTTVQKRLDELVGLVENQFKVIYADIPASSINSEDKTVFRFNAGTSTHGHIVAQSVPGELTVEESHHLSHKLRIRNPLTPSSDAMPHGNSARIWTAVMAKKVDASQITWSDNPKKATTRFFSQSFTETQVGMFAAYKTCYENQTGEQGTPSEPIWMPIW